MIYKSYKGTDTKLSLLGMGCMRLPTIGDPGAPVDYDKAVEIIDYAYNHGVNYFDTAYIYHSGDSERFIGKALSKYPRDTWYLATKMPGFALKTKEDVERIFNDQLEKCGVEYFDFYLCHGMNELMYDTFTNPEIGVIPYLVKMKEEGKIKRLGFSAHAKPETLEKFIAQAEWDFAQIQLNYFDWDYQDAKGQYEVLTSHGIPVVVMEPCRGGRLADLCEESNAILKEANPDRSIASWAFRWLQSLDNVQVVLSGMSNMDQVIENVATFEEYNKLSDNELAALDKAVAAFLKKFTVPCTACRYCSECPRELDIPRILAAYNDIKITDNDFQRGGTVKKLLSADNTDPRECVNCGTCTRHCPQNIDTPQIMDDFAKIIAAIPKEFRE